MTVGKTKDAGWEIGVSRTVKHPRETVWALLAGNPEIWLGGGATVPDAIGEQWSAADGTVGELRGRIENERLRLTSRVPGWSHESTVQFALSDAATGTTITFHQERLADAEEREAQRAHWKRVADRVEKALGNDT